MEIITKEVIYDNFTIKKDLEKDVCFFDIETTGLNRNNDIIYLIGVLYFNKDKSSWELKQFFATELKYEVKLLELAAKFIDRFETIINYNGDSFDIPFVNHRLNLLNSKLKISKEKSLDIYAKLRQNKMFLKVHNLKLKTVEEHLGIFREDKYTGRDCIEFYKDYILTGKEILKEKILKHNYDDLYYLLPLLNVFDILESNKKLEFKYRNNIFWLIIDRIQILNDFLMVNGKLEGDLPNSIYYYGSNYKVIMSDKKNIEMNFEINKGLISPTEESIYIENMDFDLNGPIGEKYGYAIPDDITLVTIDKKYLVGNIKEFILRFIESKFLDKG